MNIHASSREKRIMRHSAHSFYNGGQFVFRLIMLSRSKPRIISIHESWDQVKKKIHSLVRLSWTVNDDGGKEIMEESIRTANTRKRTYYATTNDFIIGCSAMQGWRDTMEDAHVIVTGYPGQPMRGYFAVFDGHGGTAVAEYVSKNLHEAITNEIVLMEEDVASAIKEAFLKLDQRMMQSHPFRNDRSGSTAIVLIIYGEALYCVNLGDSRAVASYHDRVMPLSTDHKPTLPEESARIMRAGGYIEYDRVNGDLALSRAFGDFMYKQNRNKLLRDQIVSPLPDIYEAPFDTNWEFVVLACDGIWDVMSNEAVCKFVRSRVVSRIKPSIICEELLAECICKQNCSSDYVGTDNMTAMVVVFKKCYRKPYKNLNSKKSSVIDYLCYPSLNENF